MWKQIIWAIKQIRDGIWGYVRGHVIAWLLGIIFGGSLMITRLSYILTYGPWFIATWAFLFLSGVLVVNSILQTINYRQRFLPKTSLALAEDQQTLLSWANNLLGTDNNIGMFLNITPTINLLTIYSSTLPVVEIRLQFRSSITTSIEIGKDVTGNISEGSGIIVGDTPKQPLNSDGTPRTLRLFRGGEGSYVLFQVITPDLRERWIKNRVRQNIMFDLSSLNISIDVLDWSASTILHTHKLPIPGEVSARLPWTLDWPWGDERYKNIKHYGLLRYDSRGKTVPSKRKSNAT